MQLKHFSLTVRLFFSVMILFSFLPLGFAQDSRPIVRLIYFLPSDRAPQPDIDAKMDTLIKDVQQFFANQMEVHGFGRKTFQIETDTTGKAVVHHVVGRFTDQYYSSLSYTWDVWDEIDEQFDAFKNIYFTAIDISSEILDSDRYCGRGGSYGFVGGKTLIPASGACFNIGTAAHELGHAFGLQHDFRGGSYLMSYSGHSDGISKCAAEWLDVHSAFNPRLPNETNYREIKMLPPSLASPPNAIRLRFEVSDTDGLHQAQLMTPTLTGSAQGYDELLSCQALNGSTNTTVELVTTALTLETKEVSLKVIDVNGNFSQSRRYPIYVDALPLSEVAEVVSIPDPHLAAAVKEVIGDSITTYTMLYLTQLHARNRHITDLTGLAHAHNLTWLYLFNNTIVDVSPLAELIQLEWLDLRNNGIVDVSPLAELTQLTLLNLDGNTIVDVSPLAELIQLEWLDLRNNGIVDVSPLAELTQLTRLGLSDNGIVDVSPLAELTQLTGLGLSDNGIVDVSPLAELTQLTGLGLSDNGIVDVSPLAELTQLTGLDLRGNYITDISPLAELTQLTSLNLRNNGIVDVSPLAELIQLEWLNLDDNGIVDVSPLAELIQLEWLDLRNNGIVDVSPLAELIQLTSLTLSDNDIVDVSPLAELIQLTSLTLSDNDIVDVSPLAELIQLEGLYLSNNNIVDVSPLAELTQLTTLSLWNNPLNYAAINTHIPAMLAKGVAVRFDNVARPALLRVSGDSQEDFAGKILELPLVLKVQDEHGQPMSNVAVTFAIDTGEGVLTRTKTATDADGKAGTTLTLGWTPGMITIRATATNTPSYVRFTATATVPPNRIAEDVNGDGSVDVEDLVLVAASFGVVPIPDVLPDTDVNNDGEINDEDVALVLAALEAEIAAPAAVWAAERLQRWIAEAKRRSSGDETFQRGIAVLEQLLDRLLPKETALLSNYPNPFNPETWIPYQLAKAADVTLHIYTVDGALVQTLELGHQPAGIYHNKNRAAYWNGRNEHSEPVASGVYFYTLTAGNFTATRKMLIRK